ncbi:diguanylate cyclase (GGDEF)-like protein [Cryobacterium sp. MP_M5]|uniref:tetratricopeptide repeat-containing diguanylate cyclase n=1 Tax=unclassified Cryobacterium TaxID=2649013 RepID=UPI0018CABE95|nr:MULTISPECIES: diguanylate cyclase [unclassified Cryobacterium]MBG6058953.1 diguanylate cyclase (GGDEF)-like protein [Cryobacterium sp. MP_M3]MEC5177038.1 diguanylate cyclase (GGDEF)-like protein [Cryobacterium sp. MP_M5]
MNSNQAVSERRDPPQDPMTQTRIEDLLDASERLSAAGSHLDGAAAAEAALATAGISPVQQAHAREMLALHRLRLGNYQESVQNGLLALEYWTASGDLLRQSKVHCTLALAYTDTGLPEQALSHAVPALEAARASGSQLAEFWALTRASTVHGAMGDTARGVEVGRQALALSRTLDDTEARYIAVNNLGDSCLEAARAQRRNDCDPSQALQEGLGLIREAVALAHARGHSFFETIALTNLVSILIELDEHDEAREKAHRCKDLAHVNGFRNLEVNVDAQLAEVVRAEGDLDAATAMMDAQLACPTIDEDPQLQIRLHQALYEMHKQRGHFGEALHHYERLHALTLKMTTQTAGLQSQLLINTLEVEQARHEAERSQLEAEVQRVRAEELDDQAHTDPLTRLPNRRALDRELPLLMDRARDLSQPACAAMIDFDNFKLVNDEYGHAIGDVVLTAMAEMLRAVTRESDLAVRVGGEEFLLVFGNTELDQAVLACERLLTSVRDYTWDDVAVGLTCTVSAGLAALHPAERVSRWLERADVALYAAKHRGRDQVVTADD